MHRRRPQKASVAMARDGGRCRSTGFTREPIPAWIILPAVGQRMQSSLWDEWDWTPFLAADNVITMQAELRFHFHNSHFTADIDDGYRIFVLRAMGDAQKLLPSRHPPHARNDASVDRFLRIHCRYSLSLMLRDGDIRESYPNGAIMTMMHGLGVDFMGNDDLQQEGTFPPAVRLYTRFGYPVRTERSAAGPCEMAPLTGERRQTEPGKEILADAMRGQMTMSLDESGRDAGSDEEENGRLDEASRSSSPDEMQGSQAPSSANTLDEQ